MASTSTAKPSSAMEESPNWLEMPHELMANILQRLGTAEILNSARKVCTTWRRICKNPEMWKVIVMHKSFDDWDEDYALERLTKQAVDLSCGELIDISIKGFGTDELLDYIVLRSCKLKRLSLKSCYRMTETGLIQAVKRVPQLEELHIFNIFINTEHIEAIGRNYPQLKSFGVNSVSRGTFNNYDDNALAIASNMPELRCLGLLDKGMTNKGLEAILNGCPHLESLYIGMCYNLNLDGDLKKLCMERIKDFKFYLHVEEDEEDDYDDFGLSSRDVDGWSDYDD
ncbi:hypothetical protein L2E82_39756 [Cichorium intybus]|uniref:Uncharacterized protein n=1 Tax=Cichorium intybus TaxID=13427 RepID=A0ACB9AKU2_CICIN|nr:hypothetical protein L2E82_39756 [Cichorium intybus]